MAIYVGNTLVADVGGGGVSLSTSTATRYLTGSASTTGSTENLYTNSSCYMSSNNLYSNGSKVITEADNTKLIRAISKANPGYINLGGILLQWGTISITGNKARVDYFPTTFSSVYSAVCTWDYDNTGSQENYAITSLSTSSLTIMNGEGTTRLFRWIAVGAGY